MCSWQTVVPRIRAVRHAVDQEPAGAADALAAVRVERDRILALRDQPSLTTSSISRKDMSAATSSAV